MTISPPRGRKVRPDHEVSLVGTIAIYARRGKATCLPGADCGRLVVVNTFARINSQRSTPTVFASFAIAACMVITGYYHSAQSVARGHLWTGHALLIAVWLFVPFVIGIVLQQSGRRWSAATILQCLSLLLLLGMTLLASLSGYLGPTHQQQPGEESYNQFAVLHYYASPRAIGIMLIGWFWLLRARRLA